MVGLLATGSELTEPGQPLAPGRIYESNRTALAALMERAGAVPKTFPLVADVLAGTSQALADAFNQCDAVVTSGGVSVGEMDFLKRAFEQIGGKLEFWKVAIKPGRPFVFGRYRGKLLFGLPGNPVSALVTFLLLVRPALLRWQGATDVSLPAHPGVLAEPLANPGERRHFMRVKVDPSGKVRVRWPSSLPRTQFPGRGQRAGGCAASHHPGGGKRCDRAALGLLIEGPSRGREGGRGRRHSCWLNRRQS